jgi:hypothetical protein
MTDILIYALGVLTGAVLALWAVIATWIDFQKDR